MLVGPRLRRRRRRRKLRLWDYMMHQVSVMVGARSYASKVMSYSPFAYWPLKERSGTVAICQVNSAQNGTYARNVATMGTGTGIGDGNTAPLFNGVDDYVDVETATLTTALDTYGAECSIMLWIKVSGAGVWTDGGWRRAAKFYDSIQDRFELTKSSTNNRLYYYWVGGNVAEDHNDNGLSSVAWQQIVMTRSELADEVKYYRDASLLATDSTIGTWGSAGSWADLIIGATSLVPTEPWDGYLAHLALFPSELVQADVDDLYVR